MAIWITELFGYEAMDISDVAVNVRERELCPFLDERCKKTLNDGIVSGVCTLKPATSGPVICCPIRLYADDYRILRDISDQVFGPGIPLEKGPAAARSARQMKAPTIAVFGKGWGGELRLPQRGGQGAYFVDWILARLDSTGDLQEFVAIEVQSIDTIGNYRDQRASLLGGYRGHASPAGFNWENVSKRILPQIIFKGHILRREPLCTKGMFFVCPTPVYDRIQRRLGNSPLSYPVQPGSLTFRWYDLGPARGEGHTRSLVNGGQFTTTIDQVVNAFSAPTNLPAGGVYAEAIKNGLIGH
jgi:hypothetical protein